MSLPESRCGLADSVLAYIKDRIKTPEKNISYGNFLSADFWQKL